MVGSVLRGRAVGDRRRVEPDPDAADAGHPAAAAADRRIQSLGGAPATARGARDVPVSPPPNPAFGRSAGGVRVCALGTDRLDAQPAEPGLVGRGPAVGAARGRSAARTRVRRAVRDPRGRLRATGAVRRTRDLGLDRARRGGVRDLRSGRDLPHGRELPPKGGSYRIEMGQADGRCRRWPPRRSPVGRGAAGADCDGGRARRARRPRHARLLVAASRRAVGGRGAAPVRQLLRRLPRGSAVDGRAQLRPRSVFLLALRRPARAAAGRAGARRALRPERVLARPRPGVSRSGPRRLHAALSWPAAWFLRSSTSASGGY